MRALFAAEPQYGNKQQLLVAILYGRSLYHFQSAVLLCERGIVTSAKVLARALCEAAFYIAASAKDTRFVEQVVADDAFDIGNW